MSDTPAPTARKSSQVLLRVLAQQSLDTIAQVLSKDESTASRVRSGEARLTIGEFCALVDAVGMKLVGVDKFCVDKKRWEAITTIAAAAMQDQESVRRLVWEEDDLQGGKGK